MHPPVTSPVLALFALVLIAILGFVEVGVIKLAYEKLGISHRTIILLLLMTLFGSYINIPIARIPAKEMIQDQVITFWGMPYVVPHVLEPRYSVIAINVGGALIPVAICLYLLFKTRDIPSALAATAVVSAVVYHFSRIVPGVGIAVPPIAPALVAAGAAYLFNRRHAPAIAYIAGTIGCLVGADVINLIKIPELSAPMASIGGAGTFDGIFISGVVAVLLASLPRRPKSALQSA